MSHTHTDYECVVHKSLALSADFISSCPFPFLVLKSGEKAEDPSVVDRDESIEEDLL